MSFDIAQLSTFKGFDGLSPSKTSPAKEVNTSSAQGTDKTQRPERSAFSQTLSKQTQKSEPNGSYKASTKNEKYEYQSNEPGNENKVVDSRLKQKLSDKPEPIKYQNNSLNTKSAQSSTNSQAINENTEFFTPSTAQTVSGANPKTEASNIDEITLADVLETKEDLNETNILNPDQDAMVRFLKSMQKELGVSPEQMIEAFDKLSAEDLMSAPEDSFDQVISNLNLSGHKAGRAEELYHNMLKETAEESFKQSIHKHGEVLNLKVEGPEERRQREMVASIERMNKNFFPDQEAKQQLKGNQLSSKHGQEVYSRENANKEMAVPFFAETLNSSQASATNASTGALGASDAGVIPMRSTQIEAGNARGLGEVEGFGLENPVSFNSMSSSSAQTGGDGMFSSSQSSALGIEVLSDDEEVRSDEFSDQLSTYSPTSANQELKLNPDEMFVPAGQDQVSMGKSDEAANIRNIIQNSQTLIERGGGQMKVQLRPEGLGQVELQVSVKDGKVDVQMLTDSQETKRLLETGFEDLKSGLAQHKLNVDNFKVDLSQKTDTQLDQNFNNANRENAREFLGQFREFNQNQRNAFFETTPLRGYGSSKAKALRPEAVEASSKAKDASRRLNLVA